MESGLRSLFVAWINMENSVFIAQILHSLPFFFFGNKSSLKTPHLPKEASSAM